MADGVISCKLGISCIEELLSSIYHSARSGHAGAADGVLRKIRGGGDEHLLMNEKKRSSKENSAYIYIYPRREEKRTLLCCVIHLIYRQTDPTWERLTD